MAINGSWYPALRRTEAVRVYLWFISELYGIGGDRIAWRRTAFQFQEDDDVRSRRRIEDTSWDVEGHLGSCYRPVATQVEPVDECLALSQSAH